MKKILLLLALITSVITHAQVAVGTSTSNMNASAQLEVTSNTKGFLPPRMTQLQRNEIANPAQEDSFLGKYFGLNNQNEEGSIWYDHKTDGMCLFVV